MDEDAFNLSIRKFLKHFGVTAQREIESSVRMRSRRVSSAAMRASQCAQPCSSTAFCATFTSRAWSRSPRLQSRPRRSHHAYENRNAAVLDAKSEKEFRAHRAAWKFFETCPPSYRRTASWRIISAKRPDTRAKRLAELIECCAAGTSIPTLRLSRG